MADLLGENYNDVEEIQLRHAKLEGGIITLERGLSTDTRASSWMMVEAVWPDGRMEDPLEALTKRKLRVVDWHTDSPRLELSDPKEQERLEKRRARFEAATKRPSKNQVVDLSGGGHEKVKKPLGGYQANSRGPRPSNVTDHISQEPSRLRGKGYERQGFEPTGETRSPLRGEYYEGVLGYARLSKIDFEERIFPILRRVGEPQPEDHFGDFFSQKTAPTGPQVGDEIEVDVESVELADLLPPGLPRHHFRRAVKR